VTTPPLEQNIRHIVRAILKQFPQQLYVNSISKNLPMGGSFSQYIAEFAIGHVQHGAKDASKIAALSHEVESGSLPAYISLTQYSKLSSSSIMIHILCLELDMCLAIFMSDKRLLKCFSVRINCVFRRGIFFK
jgi:hypothetical protein